MKPKEILDLFFYRADVFAEQQMNGAYFPTKRPITTQDIEEHLKGVKTIGAYCLRPDNTVKWGCVDIDGDENNLLESELEGRFIYKQFPEFKRMLESSGRRGYHVWIFFDKPVYASYAQQLIKARLNKIGMLRHEVFPKQISLNEFRKYGNLVKIPLGTHRFSGKKSEILEYEA